MRDLEKILEKYNIDVKDTGNFYEVSFITKKTGSKLFVPILGEMLNFGDIVAFTDGTNPRDLNKQDWIDLYIKETKK